MKTRFKPSHILAIASVFGGLFTTGFLSEPATRTIIGRLEVVRSARILTLQIRDEAGRVSRIGLSEKLMASHDGLANLEDRWIKTLVETGSGPARVKSLQILSANTCAEDADAAVRLIGPKLAALEASLPSSKHPVNHVLDAIQTGALPADRLKTIAEAQTLTLSPGLSARVYVGGDARHYYIIGHPSLIGLAGTGLTIDEVQEDRFEGTRDGRLIDRQVSPVLAPNGGRIWPTGSMFVDAHGNKIAVGDGSSRATLAGIVPFTTSSAWIVTNTNDSGAGSLRNALTYHNSNPTKQVIFKIPNTDPGFNGQTFTIHATGPLPSPIAGTILDADQQKAYTGDTNTKGPEVFLDGAGTASGVDGLVVNAATCTVRNLGFINYGRCGLNFTSDGGLIQRCAFGIAQDGVTAAPNQLDGCQVNGVGVQVGGNAGYGNIFSGNVRNGLFVTGGKTIKILGNYAGTTADGMAACANGESGVNIDNTSTLVQVGSGVAGQGNVISGNKYYGLVAYHPTTRITVYGNKIGTTADGKAALPNKNNGMGFFCDNGVVGGSAPGLANLLSGNTTSGGILISGNGNVIKGNRIGTTMDGKAALPNSYGLEVFLSGSNTKIGGSAAGEGNIISGNSQSAIYMGYQSGAGNVIQGNLIGVDITGGVELANGGHAIEVQAGTGLVIGGSQSGEGNVISGNVHVGIMVAGTGTDGTQILGNKIGVDLTGTKAIPNDVGVMVSSGPKNTQIGVATIGGGNVISGNDFQGIVLTTASNNSIKGNRIGVSAANKAIPNGSDAVIIQSASANNIVGGNGEYEHNVISANKGGGVILSGTGSVSNIIRGNYIGTDPAGTLPLGNVGVGIDCQFGANNTMVEDNLVLKNSVGIQLSSSVNGCQVNGNSVGTNSLGATSLGNLGGGIVILNGANKNFVGNLTPNVICCNGDGVLIRDANSNGNQVYSNFIGTLANGTNKPNLGAQVRIQNGAISNKIGSPTRINLIGAVAGKAGIVVEGAASIGNNLRGNSFLNGGTLDIDLVGNDSTGGFTPNDALDADLGPNQLQNYPVVSTSSFHSGTLTVTGSYDSKPNLTVIVDVYSVSAQNGVHHGGAMKWVGSFNLTTDASGHASFSQQIAAAVAPTRICLQATSASSDSSELGANALVTVVP